MLILIEVFLKLVFDSEQSKDDKKHKKIGRKNVVDVYGIIDFNTFKGKFTLYLFLKKFMKIYTINIVIKKFNIIQK